MTSSFFRGFERISLYLPLVGVAVVLILATFVSDVLNAVPLPILLAVMTLSFVAVAAHLEVRLSSQTGRLKSVQTRLTDLEGAQREFISSTLPPFQITSLNAAIAIAAARFSRVGSVRVFAASSQQVLSHLRFTEMHIERCQLLVRAVDSQDKNKRAYANQIRLVVQDWRALEADGRIGSLEVLSYDFLSTEYQVIFDDALLISGLYDSAPANYSEVGVRQVSVFDAMNASGQLMIREYVDRFDRLFEVCRESHGPNLYSGES